MSKKLSPLQKAFNVAYRGLMSQGCRSMNDNGACKYRGPNGARCAIGHMLPNRLYNVSMEHTTYKTLVQNFPSVKDYLYRKFGGMINDSDMRDLQNAHDRDDISLEDGLKQFAFEKGLTVPKLSV